ncbi:MAG: cupin domain-containing protein [Calditrichaeota bacterium]|nr:cupin domain-containing protein [Calditrichota bacterium]
MKYIVALLLLASTFSAQFLNSVDKYAYKSGAGAIQKHDLFSDDNATGVLLFIEKEVKPHLHQTHSETVYVLEGTARFYLKDKWQEIKAGDVMFIPKHTLHAVLVTSKKPLKVISIQAPKFNGNDRIFKDIN